jgi:hypothetical protein
MVIHDNGNGNGNDGSKIKYDETNDNNSKILTKNQQSNLNSERNGTSSLGLLHGALVVDGDVLDAQVQIYSYVHGNKGIFIGMGMTSYTEIYVYVHTYIHMNVYLYK